MEEQREAIEGVCSNHDAKDTRSSSPGRGVREDAVGVKEEDETDGCVS